MALDKFKEAIAALVLITLVIAALALALDSFQTGIEGDLSSVSATNESFTYTNATSVNLDIDCFSGISCTTLLNGTTGITIGSGNYSCSDKNITVNDNSVGHLEGWASTLYLIYSCNAKDYAYNVTQEGLEGTQNASSYLSTIGTLIGVAALIAVVVLAFYFVRR